MNTELTKENPIFNVLIEQLADENTKAESHYTRLNRMARNLNMPETKPECTGVSETEQKQPETVIEHLYEQLYRLRQTNFGLNEIANELEKVIG